MRFPARHRLIIGALALLLLASLAANVILYPLASRSLYSEGDRPLIERTIALAAAGSTSRADEIRSETFPIVVNTGGGSCVELRDRNASGHYGACYDRHGRLIEESGSVVN